MVFNTTFFIITGLCIVAGTSISALSSFSIKNKAFTSSTETKIDLQLPNIVIDKKNLKKTHLQLDIIDPWGAVQNIKKITKVKKKPPPPLPVEKKWFFVGIIYEGNKKYALIHQDKVERYQVGDVFTKARHLTAIGESHIIFTESGKEIKKYLYQ